MTGESKLYQNPAKKLARTKAQKGKIQVRGYIEMQGKRKHKEKREKKSSI